MGVQEGAKEFVLGGLLEQRGLQGDLFEIFRFFRK